MSKFKPEIQIAYGEGANFDLIKERLESRIVGKNRKRLEYSSYKELTRRNTFFVVFEIVRLFEVLSLDGINYAFKSIFTHSNPSVLKKLLSILMAAEFVHRGGQDQQYFCVNRCTKSFMELERFSEVKFRFELTELYNQHFPEIAQIVGGLSDAR